MMHRSGEENLIRSCGDGVDALNRCLDHLDQRSDKQKFLEVFNQAFALPKKFEFQPHKGDEVGPYFIQYFFPFLYVYVIDNVYTTFASHVLFARARVRYASLHCNRSLIIVGCYAWLLLMK